MKSADTNAKKTTQLELFPQGKTEKALHWRDIVYTHASKQDKLIQYSYKKIVEAFNTGNYDDIDNVKKIMDSLGRAATWAKTVSESLKLAGEQLDDAVMQEYGASLDYDNMTEEEIDRLIAEQINAAR